MKGGWVFRYCFIGDYTKKDYLLDHQSQFSLVFTAESQTGAKTVLPIITHLVFSLTLQNFQRSSSLFLLYKIIKISLECCNQAKHVHLLVACQQGSAFVYQEKGIFYSGSWPLCIYIQIHKYVCVYICTYVSMCPYIYIYSCFERDSFA